MFKKIAVIIIAAVLLFGAATPDPAYADVFSVNVDGTDISYADTSGSPFIDGNGRMQVPFRETLEQFGAAVSWDPISRMATAQRSGITVQVPIGKNYIVKNGVKIVNDAAAEIKDGRIYLPIRAVMQAFGAIVTWDSATQSVVIKTVAGETGSQDDTLTIHFIDVGQGDSILIDHNDYEILIDAGEPEYSAKVIDYIRPYINGDLDLVVATHEHEDHIGGMPAIFSAYQVDRVIDNGRKGTTDFYKAYYAAVSAEPDCVYSTVTKEAIDLGTGAEFDILPMTGTYKYPNENSVVSMLDYNNVKVLFMGDLETTVEKNNLDKFSDIDVLKVGHHGSRTATSPDFVNIIDPEVSVISAGLNNDYLLPNSTVIERLSANGHSVYGTFRSGDIVMTTDGNTYSFNTDIRLTAADAGAVGSVTAAAITTAAITTAAISSDDLKGNFVTEEEANYIGNSRTLKFHILDCDAAAKIADRNVVYFKTREDAIKEGYEPCKVCRP